MNKNIAEWLDIELDGSYSLFDQFYLSDLKQRKIYFDEEVSPDTVYSLVRNIYQFNADDKNIPPEKRKPILLYLVSHGGDMDAGFELIDAILNSKTPVYTINLGYQYSMGFLIGIAGKKRFATQHSKLLIHDGSMVLYNSGAKVIDQVEFNKKYEARTKEYILSKSNITSEEYDSKQRVEWYMFADEAKEKGLVDYIIGVDCDVDAIV